MKLVIFGSRSIEEFHEVEQAVEASGIFSQVTEIISGGAKGVDTLAQRFAEERGFPFRLFPPDWETHGHKAGFRRNEEMAAYADFGIAVWDGRSTGTAHMIGLMEGRVFVWNVAPQIQIRTTTEKEYKDILQSMHDASTVDIPAEVESGRLRLTLPWEAIEDTAKEQIAQVLHNPWLKTLVVLPDVHWGMNACIGTAALMRDIIIPSFVGVDIGCGMIHANTHKSVEALGLTSYEGKKELFRKIQKVIPHGKGKGNKGHSPKYPVLFESSVLTGKAQKQTNRKAQHDWGTLGSGNHFIEIGVNASGEVGITLHSGSRSPGYAIADHYCRLAADQNPGFAPHFEIASDVGQAYYRDMTWALDFATSNRWRMLEKLIALFGLDINEVGTVEKTHNHAVYDLAENAVLHRKGATPANADEYGIIPGNQLSGVYVVRGLGNQFYLCSSSHGAGRAMSRGNAFRHDTNEKFKELMAGIVCRTDAAVQDEAPWAYKDIHAVLNNQVENGQVEVVDYFKPIIVVKG